MPPALVVLILALLMGLQPLATDLYLPALPGLTHDLGASMAQAQLTLTGLLLAFGASQLVWGPVSDRFGRRPVLLLGTACFALASLGSALSPSIEVLLGWRVLQGAAMGACVMGARAVLRDLYAPEQAATVMSKALSGLGVMACISAPLGGLLTRFIHWHAALLALAVFGSGALALVALRFEETLARRNPQALRPAVLLRTWRSILGNPTFLAFSSLTAFSYAGLFTYLASSSFVFIQVLGWTPTEYGLAMFFNSAVYLRGTFWCRQLIARHGLRRSVAIAGGVTLAGGTLLGSLAALGLHAGWAIIGPMALFSLAHGIHQSCSQSAAVGPFAHAAGAASAWNGFLTALLAFFMGRWLGAHLDGSALPLVQGICFWSGMITLSAWTLVQRYGRF